MSIEVISWRSKPAMIASIFADIISLPMENTGHCTTVTAPAGAAKNERRTPPPVKILLSNHPPHKDPAKYYIAHIKLIPAED